MSDEFSKVAWQEITDELESNFQILKLCKNDGDIKKNSSEIEKHLHKIKGLAPMMGQKKIGELASINDTLIKNILEGKNVTGIFDTIIQSHQLMKDLLNNSSIDAAELINKMKNKHSDFMD